MAITFPTTDAKFEAAVDRRVQLGMDAKVDRGVHLAMNSDSARAAMDLRIIEGFKSEDFLVALEGCIKPELTRWSSRLQSPSRA